jgi:hypothetical protein
MNVVWTIGKYHFLLFPLSLSMMDTKGGGSFTGSGGSMNLGSAYRYFLLVYSLGAYYFLFLFGFSI